MTRVQLLAVFLIIAAVLVAAAQLMLWAVDRVVFGNWSSLNLVCFALRGGYTLSLFGINRLPERLAQPDISHMAIEFYFTPELHLKDDHPRPRGRGEQI